MQEQGFPSINIFEAVHAVTLNLLHQESQETDFNFDSRRVEFDLLFNLSFDAILIKLTIAQIELY